MGAAGQGDPVLTIVHLFSLLELTPVSVRKFDAEVLTAREMEVLRLLSDGNRLRCGCQTG
jgi:DNA-binding NarL/FixJ family response regulator